MERKIGFAFVTLFAFVFLISLGSAFTTSTSTLTFSNPESSKTISLTGETGFSYVLTVPSISIEDKNGNPVAFTVNGASAINGSQTIVWNISAPLNYANFELGGDYSKTVVISAIKTNLTNSSDTESVNRSVTVRVGNTYCKYGTQGSLIEINSIDDDDDFEWEPLKDIQVEVEVENKDDSSKRIITKLALYDLTKEEFVEFADGDDELEETIRISDDDDEVFVFNFRLPANIDQNNDYVLYVKAYESGEEDTQCVSSVEDSIDITSDYEVLMDELDMPAFFVCGASNQVSLKLYNIDLGDDEEMRVNLYSQELGLDLFSERFKLDSGDDEDLYFNVMIPEGKEAKTYKINFYAEYDYRESSDTFKSSENLGGYTIKVDGDKCKGATSASPTVSASLDPETETIVGKDLVVRITLANPLEMSSFLVALEGYDSWASSASLDQTSFNLGKDATKTVTATFKPTKEGTQEFTVKAIYGGKVVEQKVTVSVDAEEGFFSKLSLSFKDNLTFYLTVAIFVVLILIILVLIIRFVSSRRE